MRIRPATLSDTRAYRDLRAAVLTETSYLLREPGEYSPTIEGVESEISEVLASSTSLLLVAEFDSSLVGFTLVRGGRLKRTRHSGALIIAVRKSMWGRGVGAALLGETVEWFRASPLTRLELEVAVGNTAAVELYKKFGFEVEGVKRQSIKIGGQYCDDFVMSLLC